MPSREDKLTIINCSHCGTPLNVTGFSPYTLVECTECKNFTRTTSELGNYSISSRLGVGGMSLVFRAEDKTLGREVALKVLNQAYSSQPERIAKFEHEAKVMAMVSHPNVVKIYSVGVSDGLFYIAMELVEGSNLEAKIQGKNGIKEREALTIALEIAEGLRAGYEAGVLHRDMKPANVLFNERGVAQIVDFGLALLSGDQDTEEEIWATPHYAPPEVLERKPEDLRSDIYALGATLYHVFSGKPPILTDTQSVAELLEIKKHIPPLGEKMPRLSVETCHIVDKSMSYNPEDRFSSYEELIEALKHAAALLDQGLAQTWTHAKRQEKREKWKIMFIAGGSGVLALAIALALVFSGGDSENKTADTDAAQKGNINKTTSSQDEEELKKRAQVEAGEKYMTARNFFLEDKLDVASVLYDNVARSKDVYPLTGLWAILAGYASYTLSGEMEKGSAFLETAFTGFPPEAENSEEKQEKSLRLLLWKLNRSETITSEECAEFVEDFPPVYFIAGLRAWNARNMRLASSLFKEAQKDTSDPEWNKKVVQLAKPLEEDAIKLASVIDMPEEMSPDISEKRKSYEDLTLEGNFSKHYAARKIAALNEAFTKAKEKEGPLMEKWKPVRDSLEWRNGLEFLQRYEFTQTRDYFKALPKGNDSDNKAEIFALIENLSSEANEFVDLVGTCIVASGKEQKMKGVDGSEIVIQRIEAGEPVLTKEGNQIPYSWSKISPDSLLEIFDRHQDMVKEVPKDKLEKMIYSAMVFACLSNCRREAGDLQNRFTQIVSEEKINDWRKIKRQLLSMGLL